MVLGETEGGRALAVYLDTPVGGRSYPVTARPMTANEKRSHQQAKGAEHG